MGTRSFNDSDVQRFVTVDTASLCGIQDLTRKINLFSIGRTMPVGCTVENVLPENEYHSLDHNEFVVFREDQVQLRYLVQYED